MKLNRRMSLVMLFVVLIPQIVQADVITLWHRNFDTAPVDQFVALALSKTQDLFGEAEVVRSEPMMLSRALLELERSNGLDLISLATSSDLDSRFFTVQFPILQGLLGHRVCLIRQGEQEKFNPVVTSFDLMQSSFAFCQGEHWPDTHVLRRNGFNVKTSDSYSELFDMLKAGQCDCFLRGAQEIVPEYKSHLSDLEIEKNLVVHYFQPGVLYINRKNKQLVTRLELGLMRAWDDGSYQKLFTELMADDLNLLNLAHRTYLPLKNPQLSATAEAIEKLEPMWSLPTWVE